MCEESSSRQIKLFVFLSWLSRLADLSFLEKKMLLSIFEKKIDKELLRARIAFSKQSRNKMTKSIIQKLQKMAFEPDSRYTDEENLVGFVFPLYLDFCNLLETEKKYGRQSDIESAKNYASFKDSLYGSTKSNCVDRLEYVECELHSLMLYKSFIQSIESTVSLDECSKKLIRYIVRFTEDDSNASLAISVTFLNGLDRLIRRIAATSGKKLNEVESHILREIASSTLRFSEEYDLVDAEAYQIQCFVYRYTKFLKIPPSYKTKNIYKSNKIISQAIARLKAKDISDSANVICALLRLESYEIICQFYDAECRIDIEYECKINAGIKDYAVQLLEEEFKNRIHISKDKPGEDYLEYVDEMMRIYNIAKQYLSLSFCIESTLEQRIELRKIISDSIYNSSLQQWLGLVDSIIYDLLEQPHQSRCETSNYQNSTSKISRGEKDEKSVNQYFGYLKRQTYLVTIICFLFTVGYLTPIFGIMSKVSPKLKIFEPDRISRKLSYSGSVYIPASAVKEISFYQQGDATWSGIERQNDTTASGLMFDKNKFTASHRDLPFHTEVEITNVENQKKVVVEITDRIGDDNSEIINITESAAEAIDIIDDGRQVVEVKKYSFRPRGGGR